VFAHNLGLDCLVHTGQVDEALELLQHGFDKVKVKRHITSYGIVINGLSLQGRHEEAAELGRACIKKEVRECYVRYVYTQWTRSPRDQRLRLAQP
jgi:hypothetical protein